MFHVTEQWKKRALSSLVFSLLLMGVQGCDRFDEEDSFTLVCHIVTKHSRSTNPSMLMSAVQRDIEETLSERLPGRIAFQLIASASPDEKYFLYKELAEHTLKRSWHCPAFASLTKPAHAYYHVPDTTSERH
ncbi:hypothetical protein [Corallincola spongiicola]|uniref:Uncharacterized protein n=1 Tax=Corallincola spongiicola TaxID=2520508 RepID=A0ABY1WPB1_9GAMM|nr:hypothetical protein [Corallincola spongiicola]TAA45839.1 hypothetical protein EXY25_10810 [Corallincola spongiicola]